MGKVIPTGHFIHMPRGVKGGGRVARVLYMLGTRLVLILLRSVKSVESKINTSLKMFQFLVLCLKSDHLYQLLT